MNKIINTIKIAFLVIGAVIGAGFITGREIMRFFYGSNRYIGAIILFVLLFSVILFLLKLDNKNCENILKKSNFAIYIFNVLIFASMLGAIDSLGETLFGVKSNFPLFSTILLILSTVTCLNGMGKLADVSSILIPILLIVFVGAVLIIPNSQNNANTMNFSKMSNIFLYGTTNVFLVQPFLLKIKEEKRTFSPIGVALFSSLILVVLIFMFLGVLSDDCLTCDIPLILLIKGNIFLYYLVSIIIFIAIFTTVTAVQYPYYVCFGQENAIFLIVVSIIAFLISRMGFFVIVDKVYPAIAVFSCVYYFFVIGGYLLTFLLLRCNHTSTRQARTKLRCSPLRDRV